MYRRVRKERREKTKDLKLSAVSAVKMTFFQ